MAKACIEDGCDRKHKARGLCSLHYAARRKTNADPCTTDDCNNRAHSSGLCNAHYKARRKTNADPCTTDDCNKPSEARNLCYMHNWADKAAKGEFPPMTYGQRLEKIRARAEVTASGCWQWPTLNGYGYPEKVFFGKARMQVHRAALEVKLDRQLAKGEAAHHKCANRACVNPDHLQSVTAKENTAEMLERRAYRARIAELEKQLAALAS